MLDKAIIEFLDNKIADFLKKKTKSDTSEDEKIALTQEANNKYSLTNWLIDASNRAGQLSFTSHPAKFIHPDAKATSIIADCPQKNDGLLRSGNVVVDLDVFGNAAALDTVKFLEVKLQDNKTILQHLEQNTDFIKQQFNAPNIKFDAIRENFLKIKISDLDQTNDKLKQVYFPVEDDYHLLSVLIPSAIVYKLKQRINDIRFSEENKTLREELKKSSPKPMSGTIEDIKNLTSVGYGGANPQNISTLNSQNGGVSLLLSSMPPTLTKRKNQPPKNNFFDECLWAKPFVQDFKEFHKVLDWQKNNKGIRDKRDEVVIFSLHKLKRIMVNIRNIDHGWSNSTTYDKLDKWQKIWLDNQYQDIRGDNKLNHDYLSQAQSGFANWFISNYKLNTEKNKILGEEDIDHIENILEQEKELLK